MPEGHEVVFITCRSCKREVEYLGDGNALVGKQDRLKCRKCGERGADLIRVFRQGKKKPGTRPG